jgi:hypothetical protein
MPNLKGTGLTAGNTSKKSKKKVKQVPVTQYKVTETLCSMLTVDVAAAAAAVLREEKSDEINEHESPLSSLVRWLEAHARGEHVSVLDPENSTIRIEYGRDGRLHSMCVYGEANSRRAGGKRRREDEDSVITLRRLVCLAPQHGGGAACLRRLWDVLRCQRPSGLVVVDDVACVRRMSKFYEACGFSKVEQRLVYKLCRADASSHRESQRGERKRLE